MFDVDDGPVKKIRVAELQPGKTRVVLEVDRSCYYVASLLADPPRFFFFQAADGIRARTVTGVQTCALPIWTGRAVLLDGRPFGIPYLMRVVAVPAHNGQIVLSAAAYSEVRESTMALSRALVVATPVLLLLLAGTTWLVVGSTLRPIAALRRGAQLVTATGKARELPVPEARDEVRTLAITLNDMLA